MLWCCVIGVLNCILGVHVVLYCRWPRLYFRCVCCGAVL